MNFIGAFGSLTAKNGQTLKLENFDRDGDGKISQQEYLFIQQELGMDILELSEGGNQGERQVTDEEYVTWALEIQTDDVLNAFIVQVATDFIGSNSIHSSSVIAQLREFTAEFKSNYDPTKDDIAELADTFAEALQVKYEEIKETLLGSDDKDYLKVQEDWDKYVKDFEKNIANAGSIDEFVKLNRDYLKEHGEYIQKMLACNDLNSEERQALIQESKGDFAQIEYFSNLSGEGRNMQTATNQFIEKLAENCPGWKDLMKNPIIENPDMYMLQYFYEYRDNPNPLKESMTVEYWKHLNQQYSMLELQYQNLVESGQINPEDEVEYKPKEH